MSSVSYYELRAAIKSGLAEAERRIAEMKKDLHEDFHDQASVLRNPDDHAKQEGDLHRSSLVHEHTMNQKAGLQAALERIENGTFGKCLDCSDDIGAERLRAQPTAFLCVDCQEVRERMAKRVPMRLSVPSGAVHAFNWNRESA